MALPRIYAMPPVEMVHANQVIQWRLVGREMCSVPWRTRMKMNFAARWR